MLDLEALEGLAKEAGAQKRRRKLHPVQMLEALMAGRRDEAGYPSGALGHLKLAYGVDVDRSSFYQRLTKEFFRFCRRGGQAGAGDAYRGKSAVKLHAGVSLRTGALIEPKWTSATTADGRAVDLGEACDEVLVLLDRGYSSHDLFGSIEDRGGWYLTRLKANVNPELRAVHRGRDSTVPGDMVAHGTRPDDALGAGWLKLDGIIDVDVALRRKGQGALPARIVGVPRQASTSESEVWWYLTTLPRDTHSAEVVAQLYVLRWQIELLWKQFKSYFCIDKAPILSDHNVTMLMQLATLTYLLTWTLVPRSKSESACPAS